jgi:protocatechuate 3,4-dioxygenase beta subunit
MKQAALLRRRAILGMSVAAAVTELEASDTGLPTEALGLGPFYKEGAPQRHSLREAGLQGAPLRVEGRVMNTAGQSLPGAVVEMWHVNAAGEYDNQGFRYRGQVKAGGHGAYWFETHKPVAYSSRCAHVHVRVSAPGHQTLATDPVAARDRGSRKSLAMTVTDSGGQLQGTFHFVLRRA